MIYTDLEKKAILSELIIMAYADNILKEEELTFIKAVGDRLKLNVEEISSMINNPEQLEIDIPKKITKRIVRFHRLMLMMYIDGHVDDRELQFLHEIALRYGIRKSTVDTLLVKMEQHPHGDIPPVELLSIHNIDSN